MQVPMSRGLCAFLFLPFAAFASADEAETKAGIVRMMEVGWSVTPTARSAADAKFVELQAIAPGDPRLLTAASLVLLQQRRYEEAGKKLEELLVQDPDNILALRAKCWLAATFKNFGVAMVDAEKLRAALPAASTQEEAASEADARENLAFLGRLCGYLSGPAAENVDQLARKELEKTIITGLNADRLLIFEQARDGVTQKFFELTDTKTDVEAKNIEDRKVEAGKTLQDVEATRQEIADRVKDLEALAAKLQKELNDELADIARLDRPLVAELQRLEVRAASISNDLGNTEVQIDRLQFQLNREKDPVVRSLLRRDIDQLVFVANRISNDLSALNRQAQNVQGQRAQLAQRQAQAQNNFGGQINRANNELVALGKREKRADYEEKKAKRPVTGSSTRTVALSSLVTALSTYDKFPLEAARQRLLNELR
ncbi:hypothetical protein ETAA8_56680 [Anatilimnocola aggregata]|uniref:Tetratricopeptide repeat protein n=1 Tax=Anatilimnocola aggregata TaxID=2528021 RepID=A0A517YJX9_9BACT|nr:hypothetical protein [Anatilimnocola aggregata]QDU30523.1 hypothetical protein ETAA8_56680 [Anatilimnocola aggregata]